MRRFRIGVEILIALASIGCSDATDPSSNRFLLRDPQTRDVVHLEISNPDGWRQAVELSKSGLAQWALGTPRRGNGGFNAPWTWHIDPASVTFAEVTIEACQTAASAIDDDLDYWINFGQVCIWGTLQRDR